MLSILLVLEMCGIPDFAYAQSGGSTWTHVLTYVRMYTIAIDINKVGLLVTPISKWLG